MAAVVGFDLGYQNCYVSVARGGGIETVANEYSDRCTPTCVSFGFGSRNIGASAKQQQVTNVSNTIFGFTRFLGRPFSDPQVQEELKNVPYDVVPLYGDHVGIKVNYLGESHVFTPEQLVAMELTKLRDIAESNLSTKVVDVVLNIPTCATDMERRALLDATQIAGLNCLRIVNDTTAVGVAYGLYNKDLPAQDKPPRHVALVDIGAANTQVAVVAFNDGKMRVLSTASNSSIGGRDFDRLLFHHIVPEFKKKYNIDVTQSHKASIRLLQECEKLKKLMSANSTDIPLSIECFMDDKDVSTRMKRATFEELAQPLFQKIEIVLRQAIADAKLKAEESIDVVEMVGGSVRMPAIKSLISQVFGKEPKTTLNSDEAVARGCSFQCAILSPAFRVRDFAITDSILHGISLHYRDPNKNNQEEVMEVFPHGHLFPASRLITFYRHESFGFDAVYSHPNSVPISLKRIGTFEIQNVIPRSDKDYNKVKVKVRVNANGIFCVSQAQLVERVLKEVTDDQAPESPQPSSPAKTDGLPEDSREENSKGPVSTPNSNSTPENAPTASKPKYIQKLTDLPVQSQITFSNDGQSVIDAANKENKMKLQDVLENERHAAKNSLEEYVYELRNKLSGPWEHFATDAERDDICLQLGETEVWLYSDGEDLNKEAYIDKLNQLKKFVEKITFRASEAEQRSVLKDEFERLCVNVMKAIESYRAGEEIYNHIDSGDIRQLASELENKQKWFWHEMQLQNSRKSFEDPILTVEKLLSQKEALETIAKDILNKPKPRVESPPEEIGKKDKKSHNKKGNKDTKKSSEANSNPKQQGNHNNMEID